MGIFDFVKSAGKKLGFGDDEAPTAEAIKKEIDSYDLGSEKVEVAVEGDKAIIKGDVSDQSALEKIIVAAGNITGISKVETQTSVEEKDPVFHTVEKGDSLWKIAQKHYGDGSKYNAIFEANKPMLSDPDKIYPGQVLRIPQA